MWPSDLTLTMTMTLNFQGQIQNFLYLNKSGPFATKQEANISIELQASNVTNGFDIGHDLDIWIFKVKCDLDHLVTKVRCKDLPDSDGGDFKCRRAVDSYSYLSMLVLKLSHVSERGPIYIPCNQYWYPLYILTLLVLRAVSRCSPGYVSCMGQQPPLTHWGWDKMATNFQMTFSITFSWM